MRPSTGERYRALRPIAKRIAALPRADRVIAIAALDRDDRAIVTEIVTKIAAQIDSDAAEDRAAKDWRFYEAPEMMPNAPDRIRRRNRNRATGLPLAVASDTAYYAPCYLDSVAPEVMRRPAPRQTGEISLWGIAKRRRQNAQAARRLAACRVRWIGACERADAVEIARCVERAERLSIWCSTAPNWRQLVW